MNRLSRCTLLAILVAAPCASIAQDAQDTRVVEGDTLLIERVREEPGNLRSRGMSMAQVEAKFGAPSDRLDPRGGQKRQWPTINRWVYPAYVVYFERSKVIDVVLTQVGPTEVGTRPVR